MAVDIIARGLAAGKADLVDGKVPASELPSYVDEVIEYPSLADFPTTGQASKIYVAKDTNKTYRWSGTQYIEIGGNGGEVIKDVSALPTTDINNKIIYRFNNEYYIYTNNAWAKLATESMVDSKLLNKQDKLIAGAGIEIAADGKTISSNVKTYKPFPSSWPHGMGTTIASFCAAVNASYKSGEVRIGDAFLGNVNSPEFFSGAFVENGGSLGSAEVSVQIMTPFGKNCVQLLTTTSSNNPPYHWEYTYVDGAATEGWRSWSSHSYLEDKLSEKQGNLTAGDHISISASNVISATGIPTVPTKVSAFENDAGYLTQHQDISGKVDKPNEPTAGKGVNVPYYFDVEYTADKAIVNDYTIDLLDKNKEPQKYSLEITAASAEKSGLMVAADKSKLNGLNKVEANPTLAGSESSLSSIKIGEEKYKIPTGDAKIGKTFTTDVAVGHLEAGTNITADMKIADILYAMLYGGTPTEDVTVYYGAVTDVPPTSLTGLTTKTVPVSQMSGNLEQRIESGNTQRYDEELPPDYGLQYPCFAVPNTYTVTKWIAKGFDTPLPMTMVAVGEYKLYYLNSPSYDKDLVPPGITYILTIE